MRVTVNRIQDRALALATGDVLVPVPELVQVLKTPNSMCVEGETRAVIRRYVWRDTAQRSWTTDAGPERVETRMGLDLVFTANDRTLPGLNR
jgi:hypothetical protein